MESTRNITKIILDYVSRNPHRANSIIIVTSKSPYPFYLYTISFLLHIDYNMEKSKSKGFTFYFTIIIFYDINRKYASTKIPNIIL